ncbi:ATP-dependent zinc protease family protein [Shewanella sp.]|uniref:ATP-dependent zinc protease family protein n=1 Tax=Shewanella sp. TaxID=50422 RepID=UPI004053A5A1
MFKQLIALSVATALVSGCAIPQPVPKVPSLTNAELITGLADSQAKIIDAFEAQCTKNDMAMAAMTAEMNQLKSQVGASMAQKPKTIYMPAPVQKVAPIIQQCPESLTGEKFILGELESVYIDEVKTQFATRIDTGAESSSLDARNIVLFERNGVEWVRFDVMTNGPDQPGNTYESKVERFVRIKQDASTGDDRRPVIHAHLKIGKYSAETDLNLTDRSHLDFPLLLGRKFMKDIAIVDVGQTYIHGKANNQVTTVIK